jgi:polyribonucleotide nucleotidyltransferase
MEAALAQARDGRLHILGKLIETLAAPKKMLKATLQNHNKKNSKCIHWSLNRTWWKSDSRITKATGTTIVINEDPITEEGVIEILGTDPAGIEAVLAKIKSITFKPK